MCMANGVFKMTKKGILLTSVSAFAIVIASITGITIYKQTNNQKITIEQLINRTSSNLIEIINKNIKDSSDKTLYSFNYSHQNSEVKYTAIDSNNIFVCKLQLNDKNTDIEAWLTSKTIKYTSYTVSFVKKDIITNNSINMDMDKGQYVTHKPIMESPNTYISGTILKDERLYSFSDITEDEFTNTNPITNDGSFIYKLTSSLIQK